LFQRADLDRALVRVGVAAVEEVQDGQHTEDLALHRPVGDVVLGEHRLLVAPEFRGKGAELRFVAHQLLERSVDLVAEARKVGFSFDALLPLGGSAEGDKRQQQQQGEAFEHGYSLAPPGPIGEKARFYTSVTGSSLAADA